MHAPVVRRLLIDLETPFARHWFGGDALRTAFANALSMSFPLGEQFFIDSVRAGAAALPEAVRARFAAELQGFVGQEATHRRLHALFNAQLERQGHVNLWEARIRDRMRQMEGLDVRHAVAATAANEHFTAVLADWLLRESHWFDGTEPRLATLWLWHASEELEHRSTAFDLYLALGGDLRWRRRWMRLVTWYFLSDLALQTWRNLAHDRAQWRWSTWQSAASYLFGRTGLVRCTFSAWRAYFRSDFHPSQSDGSRGSEWLDRHPERYTAVT
jgi:predicted metal-dependent hydrolase